MRRRAIAALAALMTLSACGAQQGGPDGGEASPNKAAPAEPSPSAPGDSEHPEEPEEEQTHQSDMDFPDQDAEVVDQMTMERAVEWEDYEAVSETELRFLATSGNQSCYGQRDQVEETEDEVAVAIIMGQREGAPEICTQEAVFVAVPVQLDQPLGDRDVVELQAPELND